MKITKIIKVGYYHPSNANWNYGIWLIIDETGAKLYKENFGGDDRMIKKMKKQGIEIKEVFGVSCLAEYKGREVAKMSDIENYEGKNYIQ